MSAQNKNTGEKIRKGRLAKGYTQVKLSELTNVSLRSIQRIESGEVKPRTDTLNLLAAQLEINIDFLTLNENNNSPSIPSKPEQPNRIILQIGTAILALLLGAAYLSQSPTFPETTFELFMFWAAITLIYLVVTFGKWRR